MIAQKTPVKKRLDNLLVERGFAENREKAQRLILAGQVLVEGHISAKPGLCLAADSRVELQARPRYASRGGEKLESALDEFGIAIAGKVALDVGASTGGFTHCLLEQGAARVYAVDVGYGQLDWRLRQDPRVIVLERTNIRHLTNLPERIDLATVDVSFISLKLVLPIVKGFLQPAGEIVALIKPQFEAGPECLARGGVVKEPEVHRRVLQDITRWAKSEGFVIRGLVPSPLKGPAGNIEFFIHLGGDVPGAGLDLEAAIEHCLMRAYSSKMRRKDGNGE